MTTDEVAPSVFRYAIGPRPEYIGSAMPPVDFAIEAPTAEGSPHHAITRHGIFACNRELTIEERTSFWLVALIDEPQLVHVAAEVIEKMGSYDSMTLDNLAARPEDFSDAVLTHAQREGTAMRSIADPDELERRVAEGLREIAASRARATSGSPRG